MKAGGLKTTRGRGGGSSFNDQECFSIGNTTYDLKHLTPLELAVQFDDNTYKVLVRFSCHCFTENFDPDRHDDQAVCECRVCRGRQEKRALAVDRHQLSLQLPELFRDLNRNKTVYRTERRSFFFVRNMSVPGSSGSNEPYVVFFRPIKAGCSDIDVIIEVESAYPKTNMTRYASPVKFPRAICSTARNEPLESGKPVRVKRH